MKIEKNEDYNPENYNHLGFRIFFIGCRSVVQVKGKSVKKKNVILVFRRRSSCAKEGGLDRLLKGGSVIPRKSRTF